ncbi:tyrosine-type recombinase/integrase [Agromyces sp. NPDC058136]|uniref:tyrosine-type recombinase/integrase n=1 Tax=Agromyces sp. NPDC058136 TaxID=3346354 RepID=UPI0036DBDCDF
MQEKLNDEAVPDAERRAKLVWQPNADRLALEMFAAFQRGKSLAETTIANRGSILRALHRTTGRALLELELVDIRLYLGRPGVKATTRRTERNAIIAFYRFAVDDGLRSDDPTLRLAKVKVPRAEPRPFNADQIDRLLASGAYRRTRAMILLGYYQGFRVSSIARVHGHDIDVTGGTISTVGKGSKERVLPLHPVIAELAEKMPKHSWWFPARGSRGGHIRPASVTDLITKAKHRAGIHDELLTPHSLRHAFGTDLVENDVDIRVVQELMMHESLATTQIYTRVSQRRQSEALQALPHRDIPAASRRGRAA